MASTPILALPNFNKEFIVKTDACNEEIGEVLIQDGRPIAFLSKTLPSKKISLSTYEKEIWIVFHAFQKWRPCLMGHHFLIKTNHQSLKYLLK